MAGDPLSLQADLWRGLQVSPFPSTQGAPTPNPGSTPAPGDTHCPSLSVVPSHVPGSPPVLPMAANMTFINCRPDQAPPRPAPSLAPTALGMKTGPSAGRSELPARPEPCLLLQLMPLPSTRSELSTPAFSSQHSPSSSEPLHMLFPPPRMPSVSLLRPPCYRNIPHSQMEKLSL